MLCKNSRMAHLRRPLCLLFLCLCASALLAAQARSTESWPHWRGPSHTGVATGKAPLTWNDNDERALEDRDPGPRFSTPVAGAIVCS